MIEADSALGCELFEADRAGHLQTIVFNGYVDTIDQGTGLPTHVYLTTVRVTRDTFTAFDLRRVEPALCLKRLNAAVPEHAIMLCLRVDQITRCPRPMRMARPGAG
jgi:hypothetical protein